MVSSGLAVGISIGAVCVAALTFLCNQWAKYEKEQWKILDYEADMEEGYARVGASFACLAEYRRTHNKGRPWWAYAQHFFLHKPREQENARRQLAAFWHKAVLLHESGRLSQSYREGYNRVRLALGLPAQAGFFHPSSVWLYRAARYRELVEPVDIADWQGEDGEAGEYFEPYAGVWSGRPKRYRVPGGTERRRDRANPLLRPKLRFNTLASKELHRSLPALLGSRPPDSPHPAHWPSPSAAAPLNPPGASQPLMHMPGPLSTDPWGTPCLLQPEQQPQPGLAEPLAEPALLPEAMPADTSGIQEAGAPAAAAAASQGHEAALQGGEPEAQRDDTEALLATVSGALQAVAAAIGAYQASSRGQYSSARRSA